MSSDLLPGDYPQRQDERQRAKLQYRKTNQIKSIEKAKKYPLSEKQLKYLHTIRNAASQNTYYGQDKAREPNEMQLLSLISATSRANQK